MSSVSLEWETLLYFTKLVSTVVFKNYFLKFRTTQCCLSRAICIIALVSQASRILPRVIFEHMLITLELEIAQEQAGFWSKRGMCDKIVNLRIIFKKVRAKSTTVCLFHRFHKIFYMVRHDQLWLTMLDWNTKKATGKGRGKVTFGDGHDGDSKANENLEE